METTTTQPMLAGSPYFNDNEPKYTVACCHLKKWAWFIAGYDLVMGIVFILAGVYVSIITRTFHKSMELCVVGLVVLGVTALVLFVLLCFGLKRERPGFIVLYLILYWCWIVWWAFMVVIFTMSLFSNFWVLILLIVIFVAVSLVFRVGLQIILHKTHKYLREKQRYNLTGVAP